MGEGRGRGRFFFQQIGRGRSGRGRGYENKSNVQCFHCKKFSHVKADCWVKNKQPEKEANLVAEEGEVSNVFMASTCLDSVASSVWLVDSGRSNHMMGDRRLYVNLNESQKVTVRLGNDKEMLVHGVGTMRIETQSSEQKQLQGVPFVPGLAHNLLSVGQLLSKGYSVMFTNDSCIITENQTKHEVITIQKSSTCSLSMFQVLVD